VSAVVVGEWVSDRTGRWLCIAALRGLKPEQRASHPPTPSQSFTLLRPAVNDRASTRSFIRSFVRSVGHSQSVSLPLSVSRSLSVVHCQSVTHTFTVSVGRTDGIKPE